MKPQHADRELEELLSGRAASAGAHTCTVAAAGQALQQRGKIIRKTVTEDDLCPICYEPLLGVHVKHLTWCTHGCGQNVHGACMREWVQHQQNTQRVRLESADGQRRLSRDIRIQAPVALCGNGRPIF